jgi:heme-degrading monooxygenase HmoA
MIPLVARIWRTRLDESRAPEYEDFARNISLPMFRRHNGFLGVLFATGAGERVVITLWSDRAAVAALDASADYQATVRAIGARGFLRPPQRVELLDVHSSWTEPLAIRDAGKKE